MSKGARTVLIAGGVLVLIAAIAGGGWLWFTRRAFPNTSGTVQLEGLDGPVEIIRDRWGVPHIYATTEHDLFFAQGYVQAQDRYFQMEFGRRVGAGQLAELFGESQLDADIFLRSIGYRRVAEQEWASAEGDFRAALEAFSAGVNAYTQTRAPARLGLEFALLELQGTDVTVRPWEPVDTLTWQKVMSQSLSYSLRSELEWIDLIAATGMDAARTYIQPPFHDNGFPVIVPDSELEAEGLLTQNIAEAETLVALDQAKAAFGQINTGLLSSVDLAAISPLGQGSGLGSNNWAISGELTASGQPILANDPHLGIQMPSIWYEIGLHCLEITPDCNLNVRGVTFPSVPGVVIGHNEHIAWGVTNEGFDVLDLYIERVNPENPNQYEVEGEWVDMETVYEEIRIAGEEEPYVLRVRSTRNGPVMSDETFLDRQGFMINEDGSVQLSALSVRWTALEPNHTFQAIFVLNHASNYEEFREALAYWDGPGQNVVYADREGNIAYQSTGLVPIRGRGDGTLPMPGWLDEYQWRGYIPYDQLPRSLNPDKGYVATANQPVVSENYRYLLGTDFDAGYRAERIRQMIEADTDGISIEDVQAMQGDNLSLSALEVLPYLENLTFDDLAVSEAHAWLMEWDGRMDMDSGQAALYANVWAVLVDYTFNDQLPGARTDDGSARSMDVIYDLLQLPDHPWWDDAVTPDVTETRDDVLASAFEDGYYNTVDVLGEDRTDWRWGALHGSLFRNQTLGRSGIGPIEALFNRGPAETAGGTSIVNATSWDANEEEPFLVTSVPSMRFIADLSDLSNSRIIHTTGQSGHPYHPHYEDFIDLWRMIQYHPTNWTRAMVDAEAADVLRLEPAP